MKKLFVVLAILFLVVRCGEDELVTPEGVKVEKTTKVKIGTPAMAGMNYSWFPTEGLSDPLIAQPMASPKKTTTYTVTSVSKCGQATSNVTVRVYKLGDDGQLVEAL